MATQIGHKRVTTRTYNFYGGKLGLDWMNDRPPPKDFDIDLDWSTSFTTKGPNKEGVIVKIGWPADK
jgi:hypothetical protein